MISVTAWILALLLVALALFLGWEKLQSRTARAGADPAAEAAQLSAQQSSASTDSAEQLAPTPLPERSSGRSAGTALLPPFQPPLEETNFITRRLNFHTIIPNRPAVDVRRYTVDTGDSIFEIANRFSIKPETVLWANYDLLNDNPDLISIGMELNIPPVDGVYYEWKEGDTLEAVAGRFKAEVEDILDWSGNNFDLANPQAEPGQMVLIPGGVREFRQWLIPTIPRGQAGVSPGVYGAGTCSGGYDGALGTGGFVWPAGNHVLSGNDYWSGHLAIDIAAGEGAPVYAADSGVVVFAGPALGGYGNMVMIDHGNGYQTVYAHLSSVGVRCGGSVGQGGTIGYAGSTGNSTGPHLHFEVRYLGGFVNPWYVLP